MNHRNCLESLESRLLMSVAPGAPAAPTALTATVSGYSVKLHWVDNSSNETGFVIEQFRPGIGYAVIGSVGKNATYWTDQSAPVGLDHFQVCAVGIYGSSLPSNAVSATVVSQSVVTIVAPSTIRGEALSGSKILLTWSGDGGVTGGYTIQRSTNGTSGWVTAGTSATHNRTFLDKNLLPHVEYFYRVVAIGNAASATSGAISLLTLDV